MNILKTLVYFTVYIKGALILNNELTSLRTTQMCLSSIEIVRCELSISTNYYFQSTHKFHGNQVLFLLSTTSMNTQLNFIVLIQELYSPQDTRLVTRLL